MPQETPVARRQEQSVTLPDVPLPEVAVRLTNASSPDWIEVADG